VTQTDQVPGPPRLETKLVVVLADDLGPAEAANAAAVLALSAGLGGATLGPVGVDADGLAYGRIDRHPVPVLQADRAALAELHRRATEDDGAVRVVAFSEVARRARDYDAYLADLAGTSTADNAHVGLLLSGPRHRVTAATKRLRLFGS
jgi:hypothetical protein